MNEEDKQRLVQLEELAAHQSQAIDDLSTQIAGQWKLIERLKHQLTDMTSRFEELEDQTRAAPQPTQKPPHW